VIFVVDFQINAYIYGRILTIWTKITG